MNQAHPQVCLRAMEPEDLDLLYRIENDKTLWDIGATNVPYSRYTLHEYISQTCGDIYTDRQVRLMIDNEEGVTVGIADIVRFDPKHKRAEVGLVVERPYRRRGYASAALLHLCDYALRQLHLHQLYALIAAKNLPSQDLFCKAGFRKTSVLTDWLYDGQDYQDAFLMQYLLVSDAETQSK